MIDDSIAKRHFKREVINQLAEKTEKLLYTVNGQVLDKKTRLINDIISVKIYLRHSGLEIFPTKDITFFNSQVELIDELINSEEYDEAALRLVCLETILGLDIRLVTTTSKIANSELNIPEEYKPYIDVTTFANVMPEHKVTFKNKQSQKTFTVKDNSSKRKSYYKNGLLAVVESRQPKNRTNAKTQVRREEGGYSHK